MDATVAAAVQSTFTDLTTGLKGQYITLLPIAVGFMFVPAVARWLIGKFRGHAKV